MELAEIRPFEPQMAEIDLFTMPDAVGVGEPSVRKVKPYIAGHVIDGSSTFTFQVNGSDVTVSVSGGDWKYKPTAAITSLAFVGVPQLESLELNKITGVSTFNLDYPVVPVFKKCDATTENALVYVYHIRGTATDDFQFTLKYIDGSDNVTEVTESAVIDGNGKWDITYSGKKIKELYNTFNENALLTSIQFTEKLDEVTQFYGTFRRTNVETITFAKGTTLAKCKTFNRVFCVLSYLERVENSENITLENCTDINYSFDTCKLIKIWNLSKVSTKITTNSWNSFFYGNSELETLHLESLNVSTTNVNNDGNAFKNCKKLTNLFVPQNSQQNYSINLSYSPLSYDSMLRVAGWLKDLSGGTAQTITFKADTYNALTAEQQAALTAIIVTEKGWNLATA